MGSTVDALAGFPWDSLPPSARVDVLGWYSGKPAIRLPRFALGTDVLPRLATWAHLQSASIAADDDFVVVATRDAEEILALDQSPAPHALDLGIRLGYPVCCATAIARAGELRIDELAETAALDCRETLLDTSGYTEGRALISHVPCSPTCVSSVELAHRSLAAAVDDSTQVWSEIVRVFAAWALPAGAQTPPAGPTHRPINRVQPRRPLAH